MSEGGQGGIRARTKIVHNGIGGLAATEPRRGYEGEGRHNYSAVHAIDPTRVA